MQPWKARRTKYKRITCEIKCRLIRLRMLCRLIVIAFFFSVHNAQVWVNRLCRICRWNRRCEQDSGY